MCFYGVVGVFWGLFWECFLVCLKGFLMVFFEGVLKVVFKGSGVFFFFQGCVSSSQRGCFFLKGCFFYKCFFFSQGCFLTKGWFFD